MRKKLLISIVLAAALLALAATLVDREKFFEAFATMQVAWIAPVIAIFFAVQCVRIFRWWLLVRSVSPQLSLGRAASAGFAGFMAINLIPFRAGEVVRPLVLKVRDGVPFSAALATVVAERVIDALAVFALLLASLAVVPSFTMEIGGHALDLRFVARMLLVIFVPAALFLGALVVLRGRLVSIVERVLAIASPRLGSLAARILGTFVEGLEFLRSPMLAAQVIALTCLTWGGSIVGFKAGFGLFDIDLPLSAAIPVLAITMAGITVPAGIGMSGNFQVFCGAALVLYGIDPSRALAYAVVMNVVMFAIAVGQGVASLPFLQMPFADLFRKKNGVSGESASGA